MARCNDYIEIDYSPQIGHEILCWYHQHRLSSHFVTKKKQRPYLRMLVKRNLIDTKKKQQQQKPENRGWDSWKEMMKFFFFCFKISYSDSNVPSLKGYKKFWVKI